MTARGGFKRFAVVSCIVFAAGIAILAAVRHGRPQITSAEAAIEILLYGTLWVSAVMAFVADSHGLRRRLKVPSILAGVVFAGCTVYAIMIHDQRSGHFVGIGVVLALLFLAKGLLGPLAAALSLTLAAYAWLYTDSHHVPVMFHILEFTFGQVDLAFEYLTSFLVAGGSLATMIEADIHLDYG